MPKYLAKVFELFGKEDIEFNLREDWCNYLYLNGIIDSDTITDDKGNTIYICRFSSPFVQQTLYSALSHDLYGERLPVPVIEILDELEDVFIDDSLNLGALLNRYKDYLKRLKAKGLNPWKDQPLRSDLRLTEAVGHFHLYAWLQAVVGRRCVLSPEFPTGNGKVDLHLQCGKAKGIIEVKSFHHMAAFKKSLKQAADYARSLRLSSVTIAIFVPTSDENIITKLSINEVIDDVTVDVTAIGWEV